MNTHDCDHGLEGPESSARVDAIIPLHECPHSVQELESTEWVAFGGNNRVIHADGKCRGIIPLEVLRVIREHNPYLRI